MQSPRSPSANNLVCSTARPRLERVCAVLVLALGACSRPAPSVTQRPAPSISAPQVNAAPPPPGRTDPTCAAPLDAPGARAALRPARGQLVLGVLAGLKDANDDNLAHLHRLALEAQRRGAEMLVADGDLGDNSEAQAALLGALLVPAPSASAADGGPADAGTLPLLVVAGNRELRSDLDAAEAALRKRGATITDLSHTRLVDLGDAVVIGLPGASERRLLRADGACLYAQSDLDALATFLDKQPPGAPPALLVAAMPARGDGAQALDFTDGQNVGDARLTTLLTPARARFGVFAQVWEAGGRAVDGQGHPLAAGAPAAQLYLNPGAADRTPWPMNDGSSSHGQAALLTLRAGRASFETIQDHSEARAP